MLAATTTLTHKTQQPPHKNPKPHATTHPHQSKPSQSPSQNLATIEPNQNFAKIQIGANHRLMLREREREKKKKNIK